MIPTFDCASYLEQALRSVLAQDPGPEAMQIEVVDDASTDDPEAVVRDVAGDRVGFHRQRANVGHVRNFATCIGRARGELVHLLHGDDWVMPGFYEALERGFGSSPAIGLAFCRWTLVDADGRLTEVAAPLQATPGPVPDAVVTLAEEQRIVTPSVAVRRTAYEQLGGFDERLRCAEDYEMWVRVAGRFEVWYEPTTLAAYRRHDDSNTGRHLRGAEELRYTATAIDLFRGHLPPDRRASVVRRARRAYAATALEQARTYAAAHDGEAARANLRVALGLSRSPRTLATAAALLPRVVRP
jgi:glycosyltransferase involved in cell wall biosynthesis